MCKKKIVVFAILLLLTVFVWCGSAATAMAATDSQNTPVQLNGIGFAFNGTAFEATIYCTVDEAYLGKVNVALTQGANVQKTTVYERKAELTFTLNLNQMGMPFTVRAYSAGNSAEELPMIPMANASGQVMEDSVWTYSFEEYIKTVMQGDYSEETKRVASALLEYANCFGAYFEDKEYTPAELTAPTLDNCEMEIEGNLQLPWKYEGMTLYFGEGYVYPRLYFKMDLEKSQVEQLFPTGIVTKKDEGYYSVTQSVAINELDRTIEIGLNQNGNTITYRFSALTYFKQALEVTKDTKLHNLLCATYDLFETSKAYVNDKNANEDDSSYGTDSGQGTIPL